MNTAFRMLSMWAAACLLAACESLPPPDPMLQLMPREIRLGQVEAAVQTVEREVSAAEVQAAINRLIEAQQLCMPAPGLWLAGEARAGSFTVRYDLMERDWGASNAAQARDRMEEFVAMGFLTPGGSRSETTYSLTELGRSLLKGTFGGRAPPSFCGVSGRRVVEIVDMQWGAYDCGSLHVTFRHGAEDWPDWALSELARARVAQSFGDPALFGDGAVSLNRYWVLQAPPGETNGALRSMCYDADRQGSATGDLVLRLPTHAAPTHEPEPSELPAEALASESADDAEARVSN